MTLLLVAVGGSVGALTRFSLERWSVHRFHERMPWGTLVANLLGALVLGTAAGLEERGVLPHAVLLLVGTGFCGALTTFSGFMGQVENRWRHRATRRLAVGYLVGSLAGGVFLAGVAYTLAR